MKPVHVLCAILACPVLCWCAKNEKATNKTAKKDKQKDKVPPNPRKRKQPPRMKVKSPLQLAMESKYLCRAIRGIKPFMKDRQVGGKVSQGAWLLVEWMQNNINQVSPQAIHMSFPDTSHGLIMKDADAERGKKLCGKGKIVQIYAVKTQLGKIYAGIMFFGSVFKSRVISFLAVGSTGNLVKNKKARFCGVVIGTHTYSNVRGGTTHAIQLVGMFDIPNNRKDLHASPGQRAYITLLLAKKGGRKTARHLARGGSCQFQAVDATKKLAPAMINSLFAMCQKAVKKARRKMKNHVVSPPLKKKCLAITPPAISGMLCILEGNYQDTNQQGTVQKSRWECSSVYQDNKWKNVSGWVLKPTVKK